ncbi:MAG: hypothetical protein PeribacterA2_0924 [Candidatus Peribacter riflensis]|uniref:Uncharacterized protein n=1 Tax=Candidatus Peribacter riflensis TaxID=1735162 RepID=A0A0S1STD0_9BACT|nr:MAG: hypothetical protein PeribacterA2_0924 [Candidatus Peribacter riflensis]ALM11388.1 MAG: hypothetical protein PeribacterB2_0926 [Candidatus Peribacter riflensis]ALM12490.1 MAG: hypothetical protein PeribacterC2_0925 [Candidatus Peribacter riflensis]ALM13591.1 MAG: hypothetical protein PeribacterD1_0924 [Candidatus Peribacter riflensis]
MHLDHRVRATTNARIESELLVLPNTIPPVAKCARYTPTSEAMLARKRRRQMTHCTAAQELEQEGQEFFIE